MNKRKGIDELCNLLSRSLRHKIGSLLFEDKFYANKYAKDSEILLNEAKKIFKRFNFNNMDKQEIKKSLTKKLNLELLKKEFIPEKKFEIMNEEIEKTMINLFQISN